VYVLFCVFFCVPGTYPLAVITIITTTTIIIIIIIIIKNCISLSAFVSRLSTTFPWPVCKYKEYLACPEV
jgi:hypothetical protein